MSRWPVAMLALVGVVLLTVRSERGASDESGEGSPAGRAPVALGASGVPRAGVPGIDRAIPGVESTLWAGAVRDELRAAFGLLGRPPYLAGCRPSTDVLRRRGSAKWRKNAVLETAATSLEYTEERP